MSAPASIRDSSATRCRVVEQHDAAAGDGAAVGGLDDLQVRVGEGGDLRQVGHDDDLVAAGEPGEPPTDLDGGAAADAGVDLVEDHDRHRVGAGEDDLDGEHHARELAAGGALLQRPRRRAGVRHEQQLDLVDPVGPGRQPPVADAQAVVGRALGDLRR